MRGANDNKLPVDTYTFHSAIAIAFKATVEATVYPIGQTSPAPSATTPVPTKTPHPEEH
jgi:hypothetical protein